LAYARACEHGVDPDPLLVKAGLTKEQIDDRTARVKVQSQIAFLNRIGKVIRDPLLGFHLAHAVDLRQLGLLYYVVASSDTFGDAWQRGARYTSVTNEGVSLEYREGPGIGMKFDYIGVPRHVDCHQIEFCMAALLRLCRQLTNRRVMPLRVTFTHHRHDDPSELSAFFGCPVEFGRSADRLTFAVGVRNLPVVSADPYLNEILIAMADQVLAARKDRGGSLRSDVENAVVPLLPHGLADITEVARRLGFSKRTLARRLSAEGLTFSAVLEDLRGDLARQYLGDEALPISRIAWLLGYQEISAFTHAFKRWTGLTPRAARAQQRRAGS
jgi:AraC-like DNA-binding protein